MGVKAASILSRFFKRRDEQEDEVFTEAEAVALINEAQDELTILKLIRGEATLTFPIGTSEVALPDDFSALATDRAYYGGYAYLWNTYDGPTSEGLFIIPGYARLYPAPTEETIVKFEYYKLPTAIDDAPAGSDEVMNGLDLPSLDRFILFRMLEASKATDEEDSVSQGYQHKADAAKAEMVLWRHQTYNGAQKSWIDDPMIAESDAYVSNY